MKKTPIAQALSAAAGLFPAARNNQQKTAASVRSAPLLPLGAMIFSGLSLGAYAADPVTSPKESTLPTVTVTGKKEAEPDGYRATATRSTKTLQDPHDVPQAVTTVTDKLMDEQQVGSLREALRNVSGLTFNAAEGGRSGDNMMLRGFYTFGDMYLDGIRDTAQYNRETFHLEQIDVLRGSAAMLFGRGQAGGVINMVSKEPMLVDRNRVTGSVGTHGYQEVTADFNQRLGQESAFRINLMNRNEGSWRSNPATGTEPEIHRQGVHAALRWGIGTRNEFNLAHLQTRTRDIGDFGVSFNNTTHVPNPNFPAEYFWGVSGNFDDSDVGVSTLSHIHRFKPGTELRTQLRVADYERDYWSKTPNVSQAPSPTGGVGGNQTRTMDYETTTLQSDFNTRLDLFGMKHELLAGAEVMKETGYRRGLQQLGTTAVPSYNPDYPGGNPTAFKGDTYAIYAQDSLEFVKDWKLLLGVRRDQLSAEYNSTTSPKLDFGESSVRTGLSWQPDEYQHYYLSYSDSFSPTADLYQINGSASYPPERSEVVELGSKWLFMEGDLSVRAALYRASKTWERNTDLESTASILTKKRRTNGLELEAAGRITANWEVFSGVALMDAKILEVAENRNANTGVVTKADPRLVGQRARNTPRYTFNLWTTYKLQGGWKIGGGVEAKGKRYVYQPSTTNANGLFTNGVFTPNTAPSYTRWDAMVAYEQTKWAVRLNIKNVFDKLYYDALYDNGGFAVPGARREYIVTAEYKF